MVTDGFMVGNGWKQGDGLAPNLFNIVLKYVGVSKSSQTWPIDENVFTWFKFGQQYTKRW
jgi:hypothetical protein